MVAEAFSNRNFWHGEIIRLRSVEQKDLDYELTGQEGEDTELARYESEIGLPSSPEKRQEYLRELMTKFGKDDSLFFMIENRNGEVVGWINTFDCVQRHGTFRYAISIMQRYWRRGYGKEAVRLLLRYYFYELRYQKCTTAVFDFNQRSRKFHETLGFKLEGRLRQMVYTNGRHYDELQYGITRDEWSSLDPQRVLE